MTIDLAELEKPYHVTDVSGEPDLVFRLLEIGFTKGERIRLMGKSPFGSPVMVEIRGAIMALRDSEARCIEVQ